MKQNRYSVFSMQNSVFRARQNQLTCKDPMGRSLGTTLLLPMFRGGHRTAACIAASVSPIRQPLFGVHPLGCQAGAFAQQAQSAGCFGLERLEQLKTLARFYRRRQWKIRLAMIASVLTVSAAVAADFTLQQADSLEQQGDFKQGAALLTGAINQAPTNSPERKTLEFELDRLDRIKKDFPYTKSSLFNELKTSVKGLTEQEFDGWVAEGRFDSRVIDGERRFMASSISNLFFRYPELNPRRTPPKDTRKVDLASWETVVAIKKAAREQKTPCVLPKRFRVDMTVTANSNAAPAGQTIRAWIPVPREYPFQSDFTLLSSSSPIKKLAPANSPIRSAYLEQTARKDKSTVFELNYEYTMHGVYFDVQPNRVRASDPNDPALKPFLGEAPHIVFTPEMRALSDKIAGKEKNPAIKAKEFYDWIADNIKYSYAIEYSTIRNIGDYCRSKGYGDCGQEAFLFMTLCRLNGIPARWQTGWNMFPGAKSIHDWCEIYLEPYGWMPVDPYKGIFAMRYATSLTPEQRREVRDFYFGGLDYYRMVANSDHNQQLDPPKTSMRSDDIDFQRGELEWDHHNIYFDQYSWDLTWKEVKKPEQVQ
jgi:transglutaminase-like putative cysteine protease